MINNKRTMTREQLRNKLNYEHEHGYPSFRNEIAKVLQDKYNMDFSKAKEIVWDPKIINKSPKILNGLNIWDQNFWAKYIYEEYESVFPKRVKNLELQVSN
ncbi:Uncharacterised protein [[Flavobacterium] thermophilum]|nr:Uncharacterised protein [[Flavobacterium] thermophilum]